MNLHAIAAFAAVAAVNFCHATAQSEMKAYAGIEARQQATLSFWDGTRGASCRLEYGAPEWKGTYASLLPRLRGKRLRFGKDGWARFECSVPVTIGDTKVAAGAYCLAFDCGTDGVWSLVLLDAERMRSSFLVAFMTMQITGIGTLCPLELDRAEPPAARLSVSFVPDPKNVGDATLEIRWGPKLLTSRVVVDLAAAKAPALPASDK